MTSRSYVCPRAQHVPYTMNKTLENIMPLLRKLDDDSQTTCRKKHGQTM